MTEPRITIIPGVPKRRCSECGAQARAGEVENGRCWKCQRDMPGVEDAIVRMLLIARDVEEADSPTVTPGSPFGI